MTITIMKNKSEDNMVNKQLETVITLTGTLRNNTSVVNPEISIEGTVSDMAACNYMYIPDFKRYYYITDIKSIHNKLYDIYGRCDVLMSFKDYILSNTAVIRRQENKWNLFLNDGSFHTYQNPYIVTKKFPKGFGQYQFILTAAGNN